MHIDDLTIFFVICPPSHFIRKIWYCFSMLIRHLFAERLAIDVSDIYIRAVFTIKYYFVLRDRFGTLNSRQNTEKEGFEHEVEVAAPFLYS